MQVRVPGCAGGWPSVGRACSGYLVSEEETCIWLDAGAGTLAELLCHISLRDVDALWISHLHPDHCSDLGPVRNLLAYGRARDGQPLLVLGPPGWRQWFDSAVPDSRATEVVFDMQELQDRRNLIWGSSADSVRGESRDRHLRLSSRIKQGSPRQLSRLRAMPVIGGAESWR